MFFIFQDQTRQKNTVYHKLIRFSKMTRDNSSRQGGKRGLMIHDPFVVNNFNFLSNYGNNLS